MREHLREGSARENLVKADLLRRGFEVYAGDGPTSFDICAYKYDAFIRIEVKGIPPSGRFPTGPVNGYLRKPAEQFDVLATVRDNVIKYNVSVRANFGSTAFAQCILELTNNELPSNHTTRKYLTRRQS